MKRVLLLLIVLLAVSSGILYLGIPSQQSFARAVVVTCSSESALRMLGNKQGWPGEKLNDSSYRFEQLQYTAGRTLINTMGLQFSVAEKKYAGDLILEQLNFDSTRFVLQVVYELPLQPVARITNYFALRTLKQNVEAMLAAYKKKFDGEEFVYGLKIEKSRVKDTAMISRRVVLNHYPTIVEVYDVVEAIQKYITENGGTVSNSPMLNVYKDGANEYLMMVAVPTKTPVAGNETFIQKWMLSNGYILVSEVTGGDATINNGLNAMRQYVTDHHKSSPAIPFQMLLTDRRVETDTSKWKTRLYYPVMF
jgi:hypothetical protein